MIRPNAQRVYEDSGLAKQAPKWAASDVLARGPEWAMLRSAWGTLRVTWFDDVHNAQASWDWKN